MPDFMGGLESETEQVKSLREETPAKHSLGVNTRTEGLPWNPREAKGIQPTK